MLLEETNDHIRAELESAGKFEWDSMLEIEIGASEGKAVIGYLKGNLESRKCNVGTEALRLPFRERERLDDNESKSLV